MELNIIKRNNVGYIDSREVAELIGKRHDHLLRDIGRYCEIIRKFNAPNFGEVDFFLRSNYTDSKGETRPSYLISRRGADVIAHKLTGEKGVLFTAAYVTKFHEMSECEHKCEVEELKAQAATPRLAVFNTAVRNVLDGMASSEVSPKAVMDFLRGAYKPFGIAVKDFGEESGYYSATVIACALHMYSDSGRPHAQAVSAVISKLDFDPAGHIEIVPYGLVGFSVRYDEFIAQSAADWLEQRNYPRDIPHNGIEYHVHYDKPYYLFSYGYDTGISEEIDLDDDFWGDD